MNKGLKQKEKYIVLKLYSAFSLTAIFPMQ